MVLQDFHQYPWQKHSRPVLSLGLYMQEKKYSQSELELTEARQLSHLIHAMR